MTCGHPLHSVTWHLARCVCLRHADSFSAFVCFPSSSRLTPLSAPLVSEGISVQGSEEVMSLSA